MSDLRYDTLVLRREGLTRELPDGDNQDLRWVANSATLVYGERDAVLVDTFITTEENNQLVNWVREHGRDLTYIYLTHGHGDHTYGVGQVLEAYPEAKAVARPGAVAEARREATDGYRENFYDKLFPGQIPQPIVPGELTDDSLPLEDDELRVFDTGHTDTAATSVMWSPTLQLIVGGDVVYSHTHMYLGESTAGSRRHWIAVLTGLKDLNAAHVVAGHKLPDGRDNPADIDESIQYLIDFNDEDARTDTATELYEAVLHKHPQRVNPGSLWSAAKRAKGE